MSAACELEPACLHSVGGPGGALSVPIAKGAYFIGANRQALAYTGCFNSQGGGDTGATHNLGGRSFWFELGNTGFPTGEGIHNGPDLSDRTGAQDLTFN